MLTRVDHIAIAVEDLEIARRDYLRLLGRSPSWSSSHPEYGVERVTFRLGNTSLELRAPVQGEAAADALRDRLKERGEGLLGLAFETDDVEAAVAALRRHGLSPADPASGLTQDGPSGAWRRFRTATLPPTDTAGIGLGIVELLHQPEELPPALPLGDERASVSAIDHVVVMTQAPDRAKSLYGDALGIRLALDRSFEERGLRLMFFRLGGLTVEVGARLRPDAELGEAPAAEDLLWGLALQVPDIDAARARIADAGIEVSEVRAGHKPQTRVFSVKSRTHGVATLVIEPAARG